MMVEKVAGDIPGNGPKKVKKWGGGWNKGLTKEKLGQLQDEKLLEAEQRIQEAVSSKLEKSLNDTLPDIVKAVSESIMGQMGQIGQPKATDPAELEAKIKAQVASSVSASVNALLPEIDKMVNARIEDVGNRVEAVVKESLEKRNKALEGAPVTSGNISTGDGRAGLNTMLSLFGQSLGQGFATSIGRNIAVSAGGSASIGPMVKELGETIKGLFGILEPLNDLKVKTRRETLDDLVTLSRIGQQEAVNRIFKETEIPKTNPRSPTELDVGEIARNVRLNPERTQANPPGT